SSFHGDYAPVELTALCQTVADNERHRPQFTHSLFHLLHHRKSRLRLNLFTTGRGNINAGDGLAFTAERKPINIGRDVINRLALRQSGFEVRFVDVTCHKASPKPNDAVTDVARRFTSS